MFFDEREESTRNCWAKLDLGADVEHGRKRTREKITTLMDH